MSEADGVRRGERQHRTHALAASEQAVLHRLVQARWTVGRGRQPREERARDVAATVLGELVEWCAHSPSLVRDARALSNAAVLVAQRTVLREHGDAALRVSEPIVAEARERDAALEQRERLLERQVTLFERTDDGVELGDGLLEICGIGHGRGGESGLVAATSHCSMPSLTCT